MQAKDCFTPLKSDAPGSPPSERVMDAHRSIRFDGLVQLIDEVQRRRSIEEVAKIVATRWKHCASVNNWRLLCVYGQHCALITAQGSRTEVQELRLETLSPFDAEQWRRRIPRHLGPKELAAEQALLPPELALPQAQALSVLPIQQDSMTIGLLNVLGLDQAFDALDRKFIQLVAGAMCTRILAILTEQSLRAELLLAERELMQQRQATILSRLVNGVAHELNTPLGVQISACGALSELLSQPENLAELAPDLQATVQLIEQQALKSALIVKRLKQISAAAMSSPRQPTPVLEELGYIAASFGDSLDIHLHGSKALCLELDPSGLHTVVSELLDNVLAHAGGGAQALRVDISVEQIGKTGFIHIQDNGPGMDAQQALRLFEPFYSSKQNLGHIGIGGYIAKNVAQEALGAGLRLHTNEHGTRVSLEFAGD
ncbi:signal transduction histidine kinase [Paucibacter oligotrophus]|uniref:histidine kinase n=1 Tax=Roseateles oligotrophus TaxID=1769250 RepID=A0A840L5A6_9BURK|nr:HAMP domain-containing sensor histidine kinase [Roseateles oligotrophus]MBB4841725.1 signal transduction histidine kinase [Roseateles oligotrophus]